MLNSFNPSLTSTSPNPLTLAVLSFTSPFILILVVVAVTKLVYSKVFLSKAGLISNP